jgi:hypothetical protein
MVPRRTHQRICPTCSTGAMDFILPHGPAESAAHAWYVQRTTDAALGDND